MQSSEQKPNITLGQATQRLRQFVKDRQWQQFHTPRNLVLALVGQVGEVAEIFQWKGQVTSGLPELTQKEKTHVGQQLADVFSYLIRLSDECGVDLGQAFLRKMQKNAQKYPKDLVKGSAKKYTEYRTQWTQAQKQQEQQANK